MIASLFDHRKRKLSLISISATWAIEEKRVQ